MKKSKIYLIYFEWANTKGNHAGMSYLAQKLESDYANVKLIKMISGRSRLIKSLNVLYILYISLYLKCVSSSNDKIFLMEYLAKSCFQDKLALLIRKFSVKGKIYGLVHLAGSHLREIYKSNDVIKKKMELLDECVVFGSSLAIFLKREIGFNNVFTTYHYVDTEYYKPLKNDFQTSSLRVLCLGNIKRDFNLLRNLVDSLPHIQFDICQGVMDLQSYFEGCKNVILHGYMTEDDLLGLMQKNDVCLSIMTDTVGSNVITTSLATGLALVVSDVGSIRDYCTDKCAFFCKELDEYRSAILYFSNHQIELEVYKRNAYEQGQLFSYNNFREEFERLFSIS